MSTVLTGLSTSKDKNLKTLLTGEDKPSGPISAFLAEYYLHFNASMLLLASKSYVKLLGDGGKMFLAMAGAMSTGEIGKTLAEMIRQNKVHAISCTGANLEEDVFNLVAHSKYVNIPNYRDLTPDDEMKLLKEGLPRVTDVCIPETEAMNVISGPYFELLHEAEKNKERKFPHEFLYELLLSGELKPKYEIDPENSWMLAAAEKNLPIYVPGWEDSTLGNMFAAEVFNETLQPSTVKSGIEYMTDLLDWYKENSGGAGVGFFQIGGGIAGDFSICAVPLWRADLKKPKVPLWSYFCQISDSTTSYGSYSGAVPNEKITWWKIGPETPRFVIESDASIVWPLVAAYVLGY